MNAGARWLDAAKRELHVESDYALGKALGLTPQRISHYRTGRGGMDDDLAIRIAAVCKVPAIRVIAELHADRSKSPTARAVWLDAARRAAAACLCAVILSAWFPVVSRATGPSVAPLPVVAGASFTPYTMRPIGQAGRGLLSALIGAAGLSYVFFRARNTRRRHPYAFTMGRLDNCPPNREFRT